MNTLTDILATSGIVLAVLLAISWRVEGWGARLRVKMVVYAAIIFVLALLGATVGTRDIYGSVRAEVGLILCWMTIVAMVTHALNLGRRAMLGSAVGVLVMAIVLHFLTWPNYFLAYILLGLLLTVGYLQGYTFRNVAGSIIGFWIAVALIAVFAHEEGWERTRVLFVVAIFCFVYGWCFIEVRSEADELS